MRLNCLERYTHTYYYLYARHDKSKVHDGKAATDTIFTIDRLGLKDVHSTAIMLGRVE